MEEDVLNILLNAVKEGYVAVEREGLSLRYPCRPLLIATFNPEEGELKEHFLDRIGLSLCADAFSLKGEERVQAVDNVMYFTDSVAEKRADEAKTAINEALEKELELQTSILFARELLRDATISKDQVQYLCEESIRAGVQGHRADIFAVQVAKANAALQGRNQVNAHDLKLAVQLAIAPRGTWVEEVESDVEETGMPSPTSQSSPIPPSPDDLQADDVENDGEDDIDEEPEETEDQSQEEADTVPGIPEEFQFAPDATPMDPNLLHFLSFQKRGASKGRRNKIHSQVRTTRRIKDWEKNHPTLICCGSLLCCNSNRRIVVGT